MDKRRDLRFKTRFDALYSSGPMEGAAVLVNLSYSGALLESASLLPAEGTRVRMYVFVQPVAPFEIVGHVVRRTDTGFAVAYDMADSALRGLVDDISGLVETTD